MTEAEGTVCVIDEDAAIREALESPSAVLLVIKEILLRLA
jgi:hypothetical protein